MNALDQQANELISTLDISPSDFELAKKRYTSVGNWLSDGRYKSGHKTDIYIQGSFRLGTVIRPYRNNSDADYDIDQVCEITGQESDPRVLKNDVGDRLKADETYSNMLDAEGRRCWTLVYASSEGRPGFHIDILPSRPKAGSTSGGINITHKENISYNWRSSNPKGYYYWFKSKNTFTDEFLSEQSEAIWNANKNVYASIGNVPKQLFRSNLQRAIQLMKRHRDVYFNEREHKPISILITTICTHCYRGGGIIESIERFVTYVSSRLAQSATQGMLPVDNILDFYNDKWVVPNPVEPQENFADRWATNRDYARNFFAWAFQLGRDIKAFNASGNTAELRLATGPAIGNNQSYSQILKARFDHSTVSSSWDFLDLILSGIDGRTPWKDILPIAQRNVTDSANDQESHYIALINLYQVKLHSGIGLSASDRESIAAIRTRYAAKADFAYCCGLLLGNATREQLQACIMVRGDDALKWPINYLARRSLQTGNRYIIPYLN